jgi:hypothetical protein
MEDKETLDPVALELHEVNCETPAPETLGLQADSEEMTDSSEDETRAFEQRWWHALADVAAGSGTEDSSNGSRSRIGMLPHNIDGCTGSSYDDVGNGSNYDSSGGSANAYVVGSTAQTKENSFLEESRRPSTESYKLPTPARPLGYPPALTMTTLGRKISSSASGQLPMPAASNGAAANSSIPAALSKPSNGIIHTASRSPMRTLPPPPMRRG